MMKKLRKKDNFFFSNKGVAKLYLRCSYSNIFLTLTDLNDHVIICHTSGSSDKTTRSKRRKKAPQTIEPIMRKLKPFIDLYNIRNIEIINKTKVSAVFRALVKELEFYNILILSIKWVHILAHNGVRGRKNRKF